MKLPQFLYVGDRNAAQFAAPLRWLVDNVELSFADDIGAASTQASSRAPFDLIAVAHERPGVVAHSDWESLRAAAPLTPIVSLLGSYCEGEARTGKPWPGAMRVYAHQFVVRTATQLERLKMTGAMSWAPPFTLTDDERALGASWSATARESARVAVISQHVQSARALCDALQCAGYSAIWRGGDPHHLDDKVAIVVWDCPAGFTSSEAEFQQLVERLPRTPKIVLLGFPRSEDQALALSRGATGVLSKPMLIEDLLWQIRECSNMQNGDRHVEI